MIELKQGVILARLNDVNLFEPIQIVETIWNENAWGVVVVTSGIEGTHLPNSQHYLGQAVDIRFPADPELAFELLTHTLAGWKVIKEDNHLHIQLVR